MNAEAKRLRMYSTVFMNSSGWKNQEQLSTVFDMAKLARVLLFTYSKYYGFFSTKHFCYSKKLFKNHNNLLGNKNGIIVDGIKTGFLCASGFNIAVSAKMKRKRLIAVVFGGETASSRDRYVYSFLCRGFAHNSYMARTNHNRNIRNNCRFVMAKNSGHLALNSNILNENATSLLLKDISGNDGGEAKGVGIYNKIFGIYNKADESAYLKKRRICNLLGQK
jgi:D-alanyl-D-alanine carboxypeptidase